jgi:hypothetical protein
MATILPKNSQKYRCDNCGIKTNNKKDYNNHLMTRKHTNNTNTQHLAINTDIIPHSTQTHVCMSCNKLYESRSGLWRHQKSCKLNSVNKNHTEHGKEKPSLNDNEMKNMIIDVIKSNSELLKQNQEMQKQMIDVCKNSNNNITTNSHNKTFNMQVFLNEKCKDAMNIMDFVNSMTLQLSDLEDVGELGYVEGISKIIIRKLNEIDVYKRPIHCSDYKREVMYVREDDIWEKENSTYDKIRKAIKYITKKNGDLMIPWRDKHPSCMNTTHRLNDVYLRIMNQSMGGKGEFVDSENKIIKKLSKAFYIDKEY